MRALVFAAAMTAALGVAGLAQAGDQAGTCAAKASYRPAPSFYSVGIEDRDHWVTIAYRLDEEGRTADVKVVDSDAATSFREASLKAVKSWRFETDCADDLPRVREVTLRYWPMAGKRLRAAVNPEYEPTAKVEGDAGEGEVVIGPSERERVRKQGAAYGNGHDDRPVLILPK